MKNKQKLLESMNLADERYVEEADPARRIRRRSLRFIPIIAAACMVAILTACCLWLFVPYRTTPTDVSKYNSSEYYSVIQKLNVLAFQKPKFKNNAEMLASSIKTGFESVNGSLNVKGEAIAKPESNIGESYKEVTDNQVSGIIEADRIKRSDKYIYYFDNEYLRVYLIAGEDTSKVGEYKVTADKLLYEDKSFEFYLSRDCETVTLIIQYTEYKKAKNTFVELINLDVRDPANISETGRFRITGSYNTSRMTEDGILLITEFAINKGSLDFDDESTFLPQIDTGDGLKSISSDLIVSPESLNNTRYTVVHKLDPMTLTPEGGAAYLSYSEEVYVSRENVYLTHTFSETKDQVRNTMTTISCLYYGGDGFEQKGSVVVRGYVKNQYSMDEYENILRVVTTTNATVFSSAANSNEWGSSDNLMTATGMSSASLYCISLDTFECVAEVKDFAPPREEVQSVRFDGNMAYVCTSVELSDPVFFFDLSDLDNIKVKDTGTIPGFSTSLVNFGDGYLLGIGFGDSISGLKIEIYEETDTGVTSVCTYEKRYAEFSGDYKSYYIDRNNRTVGLGIVDYSYENYGKTSYILLMFDGYNLMELVNTEIGGSVGLMRGVCIDDHLYIFSEVDFKVVKLN